MHRRIRETTNQLSLALVTKLQQAPLCPGVGNSDSLWTDKLCVVTGLAVPTTLWVLIFCGYVVLEWKRRSLKLGLHLNPSLGVVVFLNFIWDAFECWCALKDLPIVYEDIQDWWIMWVVCGGGCGLHRTDSVQPGSLVPADGYQRKTHTHTKIFIHVLSKLFN